ncbi:1680_t:CDS:2, partial [Acaulospora colombiana]
TPQAPPRKDRGIIPPEEDIRRLFQECDVAKNNAQVLSGALPFATPANFSSDPVIQEFYNKCRASQELIMAQIAWASAGAERSRLAAEKAAKDSGSDNGPNRLTRQAKPGREGRNNGSDDLTKEERLLAALLSASTELMEVFKEYEQLEQMARTEKEEREIAKRSMTDTRMDRTQIHLIKPDGSVVDAPAAVNAGSSSRSPSPAIPASTRSISGTTVPTVASNTAAAKGAGGRDLPLPPHMSGEHLVTPGATPITPNAPINYPPQQQPGAPASQQQGPPYHHQHHSSTHSINNYNTATLNLPPAAPHGPRHPPSNNRSRTPSPDRPGVVSGTVPGTTSPPLMEYGPPSHPPPQHGQRGGAGGARYDSLRSGNRTESPVPGGAPPGLGGTHNVAGMRIDTDAAHRYSSDEENLMTPIRPSAKALGKRRAEVEAPPDEEELERREEEELEEAFYRSTIPVDAETPTRTVYYVYDAAAERAKELDRLEKEEQEKERLKALQARNSILRGSGGGSGTAAAAAAGGAGAQQQQPLGAVNNPRI